MAVGDVQTGKKRPKGASNSSSVVNNKSETSKGKKRALDIRAIRSQKASRKVLSVQASKLP